MAPISESSTGIGMRPLPTTAITPDVTRTGKRLQASNRQKIYPGNSGPSTSAGLPRPRLSVLSVLEVGRKTSYPLLESNVAVELSQRALSCSAYHRVPRGAVVIVIFGTPL